MKNQNIHDLIHTLSKYGRVFYYGASAILHYKKAQFKFYRILTDINVAEIGQVVPGIKFDKNYNFDCYCILEDGTLVSFLIEEINCRDDFEYLNNVRKLYLENPMFLFFYLPAKDKYFIIDEKEKKSLNKDLLNLPSLTNAKLEDILDLCQIKGELDFSIKVNNRSNFLIKITDYDRDIDTYNRKSFLTILNLILISKKPYDILMFLQKCSLLTYFFPFLNDLKGILQDRTLHPEGDVFEHTVHCFRFLKYPSLRLIYGLLLHDYGKSIVNNGKGFKYHSAVGSREVRRLLLPYGFDDSFIKDIEFLVAYHMVSSYFYRLSDEKKDKIFNNPLGNELLKLFKADTLGSIGKLDAYHDIVSTLRRRVKSKVMSFY